MWFTSPEAFAVYGPLIAHSDAVVRFAVDEASCVVKWGVGCSRLCLALPHKCLAKSLLYPTFALTQTLNPQP